MSAVETTHNESSQLLPMSLFQVCTAMTSTLELDELLELILDLTMKMLSSDRGSILLYDQGNDRLRMLASRGMPEEVVRRGYIPRKDSIAEYVMENDEPLILNDDVSDDRFTSISERVLRSSMCCPLRSRGAVIGTLNLSRHSGEAFDKEDLDALVIMATQAAVAIENARLVKENLERARLAAIGQAVSGISHCVKNMLTGLKGGMSLVDMSRSQRNWDILDSGWKMLSRSVNRISLLVLDMLDYSKEREPMRRPTDVVELVNEVAQTVEYEAVKRGVTVTARPPDEPVWAMIDGDQVFRCLLNLATNALDAVGDEGGEVVVGAEALAPGDERTIAPAEDCADGDREVRTIVFSVRDNGCGIDPEQMEAIFEPFFSTKGSKGTGIGLAVTRKITQEHGGLVRVDSQLGAGTTFSLVMPCELTAPED